MALKLQFKKEVHIFRGEMNIENLTQYVSKSFKKLPQNFQLSYIDEESDIITVNCTEDLQALIEFSKTPKITISEQTNSSDSEFENKIKKTSEKLLSSDNEYEQIQTQNKEEDVNPFEQEEIKNQQQQQSQEEQEQAWQIRREERRQKRKERQQAMKEEFIKKCQNNEQLSKMVQKIQKKVEKKLPLIEEFIQTDFNFKGEPATQQQQSNQNDNEQQQQSPMKDLFKMMAPHGMRFLGKGLFRQIPHQFHMMNRMMDFKQQQKEEETNKENIFSQFMGPYMKKGKRGYGRHPHHSSHPHKDFPLRRPHANDLNQEYKKRSKSPQQQQDELEIHFRYSCDGCNQHIIFGERFKCEQCPDFDFCGSCYDSKKEEHDSQHTFKNIQKYGKGPGFFRRHHPHHHNHHNNSENRKNSQSPQKDADEVHYRYRCDGCKQSPIIGKRYKCEQCPDFDFCGSCHDSKKEQHDSEHTFKNIQKCGRGGPKRDFCGFPMNKFFQNMALEKNISKSKEDVQFKESKTEQQKIDKKEYSSEQVEKAELICQIFGGEAHVYYGVCEQFQNLNNEDLVNKLLEDDTFIAEYPTIFE